MESYNKYLLIYDKKSILGCQFFGAHTPQKSKFQIFFWWKLQTPKYASINVLDKFLDLILPEIYLKNLKIWDYRKSFWGLTTPKIQISSN